ncbi:hypothetical protein RRG08_038628 [Elysia crispata]|uniref:Uncharacterized protein n=1 Tax=Elysia crispata TaxID=231223 RepID=A0AAE1D102_9GAST|nr:hypothetical protein RRG08_038628 [Elysia crispata]
MQSRIHTRWWPLGFRAGSRVKESNDWTVRVRVQACRPWEAGPRYGVARQQTLGTSSAYLSLVPAIPGSRAIILEQFYAWNGRFRTWWRKQCNQKAVTLTNLSPVSRKGIVQTRPSPCFPRNMKQDKG